MPLLLRWKRLPLPPLPLPPPSPSSAYFISCAVSLGTTTASRRRARAEGFHALRIEGDALQAALKPPRRKLWKSSLLPCRPPETTEEAQFSLTQQTNNEE